MEWYDFKAQKVKCRKCSWKGFGNDLKQGEWFRDGTEFDCPACGEKYSYVMWPRTIDMATDHRATEFDRKHAKLILELMDK